MNELSVISEAGDWELPENEVTCANIIGSGSFGKVFKGKWRGTPVAVKVLKDITIDVNELRNDFIALTKLHHPNILQILGACTEQEPIKIVTELMTKNLDGYTSRNTTKSQAVLWCIDIARGLAYLHNRKPKCVIHRDLKPSNLLLTPSKRIKICDFGLSCFQIDSQEQYQMTSDTGTYRYMAPEIITNYTNNTVKYNSSVDIYSFAIIMYTLFEEVPYISLESSQIKKLILSNKRSEFYNLKNDNRCNKLIKSTIINCWNAYHNKRPTALMLIETLEEILNVTSKYNEYKTNSKMISFNCFSYM